MKKLTTQEMHRLTPEAFHQTEKLPLVVVLDNVRSQHNVGAVFRTADAFLIEGVYLCGICCCPPNAEIHKTALGAEETVDWQHFDNTLEAVEALHGKGYCVYAIEQAHDSITLEQAKSDVPNRLRQTAESTPKKGIAVVLGHEVFGVQQEVVDACEACIEIPQYGTKHSLNVSVTAGIVMYELSTVLQTGGAKTMVLR